MLRGTFDVVPWGLGNDSSYRVDLESGQMLYVWLEGVTDAGKPERLVLQETPPEPEHNAAGEEAWIEQLRDLFGEADCREEGLVFWPDGRLVHPIDAERWRRGLAPGVTGRIDHSGRLLASPFGKPRRDRGRLVASRRPVP